MMPNISRKIFSIESRVFILAIFVSVLWHLLWLVSIKIVANPDSSGAVKFSNVSFLGPMSQTMPGEFKLEPRSLTFLEKRYRDTHMTVQSRKLLSEPAGAAYNGNVRAKSSTDAKDDSIPYLIGEALEGAKLEPDLISH